MLQQNLIKNVKWANLRGIRYLQVVGDWINVRKIRSLCLECWTRSRNFLSPPSPVSCFLSLLSWIRCFPSSFFYLFSPPLSRPRESANNRSQKLLFLLLLLFLFAFFIPFSIRYWKCVCQSLVKAKFGGHHDI